MVFHERLKWIRQQAGRLQKEVAEYLGMAPNAYQRYELGTREPSLDKLDALSTYFNVPSDFFLGRGIFKHFDLLLAQKEHLIISLSRLIPATEALKLEDWSDKSLLVFLDALFSDIELDGTSFYFHPRIPVGDLGALKLLPPDD